MKVHNLSFVPSLHAKDIMVAILKHHATNPENLE